MMMRHDHGCNVQGRQALGEKNSSLNRMAESSRAICANYFLLTKNSVFQIFFFRMVAGMKLPLEVKLPCA